MGLLAHARCVVAADSGPLHLAAALGTKVVGLYGPTDPARNGPFVPGAIILSEARPEEISYKRRTALFAPRCCGSASKRFWPRPMAFCRLPLERDDKFLDPVACPSGISRSVSRRFGLPGRK